MAQPIDTEAVWREFHRRLLAYLVRRVASPADAEEVLQDVFARVHASSRQATDIDSVSGWVYRIARNAITDYHRKRATAAGTISRYSQEQQTAAEDANARASEGEASPRAELAAGLRPLVERLPEKYREAVALTDLGGVSQTEAARQLGVSTSGMKSRVQRGRARLRELLVECCRVELDGRGGVVEYDRRDPDDGGDYGCC